MTDQMKFGRLIGWSPSLLAVPAFIIAMISGFSFLDSMLIGGTVMVGTGCVAFVLLYLTGNLTED